MAERKVRPSESSAPAGSSAHLRYQMVETQLRCRGIDHERVLDAMARVPRESFVSADQAGSAYDDCALPISQNQTISQPYTVAFMCQMMRLSGHEKVLEIGTGSGYAAAVLSLLAREVRTIERIPELGIQAQQRLEQLGYRNVHVHLADGTLGLRQHAPFDAIVVSAGGVVLPTPYAEQLIEGGRIVIPLGASPGSQQMRRFTKRSGALTDEALGAFAFVPLIGEHGWKC